MPAVLVSAAAGVAVTVPVMMPAAAGVMLVGMLVCMRMFVFMFVTAAFAVLVFMRMFVFMFVAAAFTVFVLMMMLVLAGADVFVML